MLHLSSHVLVDRINHQMKDVRKTSRAQGSGPTDILRDFESLLKEREVPSYEEYHGHSRKSAPPDALPLPCKGEEEIVKEPH